MNKERFKQGQEVFFYTEELTEDLSKAKKVVLKKKQENKEGKFWETNDGWLVREACLGENPDVSWYRTAVWSINELKEVNAQKAKEYNSLTCDSERYNNVLFRINNGYEISRIKSLLYERGLHCSWNFRRNKKS